MEKWMRNSPQLEDVTFLFDTIQSFLPLKEAARTSVLSKSWLHAWSTNSTLRFLESVCRSKEQEIKYMKYIDRTLLRYHRDNLPIKSVCLEININNQESVSLAEKWIRLLASKSSVKKLYLTIWCYESSFTLTDEIFSGKNLNTISVKLDTRMIGSLWINSNPVINCVSLRVLKLINVNIHEEVLEQLLSTCILLEKIELLFQKGLQKIKVKNLHFLRELRITSKGRNDILEIDDVPSLRLVFYDSTFEQRRKPLPCKTHTLRRVTHLHIGGVIMDDAFFNMINSKCPFLESLSLEMWIWTLKILNITSVTVKRLTLQLSVSRPFNLQVYAPNVPLFCYVGKILPTLLFRTTVPEHIKLKLELHSCIDVSFFLKLRETLNLSSEFDIEIITDINDLRITAPVLADLRITGPVPATNMQQLSFKTYQQDTSFSEYLHFFDAFFTICHPSYVKTSLKGMHYFKQMVRDIMEKKLRKGYWHDSLKDVEIIRSPDRNGPTSSWRSFGDGSTPLYPVEFKLNWCTT